LWTTFIRLQLHLTTPSKCFCGVFSPIS
jgi:hypothetical protein